MTIKDLSAQYLDNKYKLNFHIDSQNMKSLCIIIKEQEQPINLYKFRLKFNDNHNYWLDSEFKPPVTIEIKCDFGNLVISDNIFVP